MRNTGRKYNNSSQLSENLVFLLFSGCLGSRMRYSFCIISLIFILPIFSLFYFYAYSNIHSFAHDGNGLHQIRAHEMPQIQLGSVLPWYHTAIRGNSPGAGMKRQIESLDSSLTWTSLRHLILYYMQYLDFVQPNRINAILPALSFPHSDVYSEERLLTTTPASLLEHSNPISDQLNTIVDNSEFTFRSVRTNLSRSAVEDRERLRDKSAGYFAARERERLSAYVKRTELLLSALNRDALFPDEDPVTGV